MLTSFIENSFLFFIEHFLEIFFFSFFLFFLNVSYLPFNNYCLLRRCSLFFSILLLVELCFFGFSFVSQNNSLIFVYPWLDIMSLNLTFSVDFVTWTFLFLTGVLFFLSILSSWNNIRFKFKIFLQVLILIYFVLVLLFLTSDLLFFYVTFESVLIPMFFLIGVWGSRQRKTYAVFLFFFYTFVGSLFMFFSILILYSMLNEFSSYTLLTYTYSNYRQLFIWLFLFIAFAVKVPMFPVHIWLPEAHVEAPTVGSVILAGVLLKLGMYGLIRFALPVFPFANFYYLPIIYVLGVLGIFYVSCTTIRQIDLKKIVAYASIAHMNYVVLGLFCYNEYGILGSIFLMLSHGIVSGALFFLVGFLYDRYKTRLLFYYGSLCMFMPLYCFFLFYFSLANMSFPGTSSFVGEFFVLLGILNSNIFVTIIAIFSIILCSIYSIWLFNRIAFGYVSQYIVNYSDLSKKEFLIVFYLAIFVFLLGVFPNIIFNLLENFELFYFI